MVSCCCVQQLCAIRKLSFPFNDYHFKAYGKHCQHLTQGVTAALYHSFTKWVSELTAAERVSTEKLSLCFFLF